MVSAGVGAAAASGPGLSNAENGFESYSLAASCLRNAENGFEPIRRKKISGPPGLGPGTRAIIRARPQNNNKHNKMKPNALPKQSTNLRADTQRQD